MKKWFAALPPLLAACMLSLGSSASAAGWTDYRLVAHALGGIDQKPYTNSYEAFVTNYEKGQRVFEIDLQFTSDGCLVGRHDWSLYAFQSLGQPVSADMTGGPLPLDRIRSLTMFDQYHLLTFGDIVDIMHEYPDAYFVTDTKSTDPDTVTAQFNQIVELLNEDPHILKRIIPQIYNEKMYGVIERVFPFESYIYTLYQTADSNQKVLQYVKSRPKVTAVTMPEWRATSGFLSGLKQMGKRSFVHTINSPEAMDKYKAKGVYGFYTDFVTPEDLRRYAAKKAQQGAARTAKAALPKPDKRT